MAGLSDAASAEPDRIKPLRDGRRVPVPHLPLRAICSVSLRQGLPGNAASSEVSLSRHGADCLQMSLESERFRLRPAPQRVESSAAGVLSERRIDCLRDAG